MSNWFCDVFLKSLYEKKDKTKNLWLTEKQLEVCDKNMKCTQHRSEVSQGWSTTTRYEYEWNGRMVYVYPYDKGYGLINFGMTDVEKEERNHNSRLKEAKKKRERIERMKERDIEKYNNIINKIKSEYNEYVDYYMELEEQPDETELECYKIILSEF